MKVRFIMCKGLPGSGKSSFADNLIANDNSFTKVEMDEIRKEMGINHFKEGFILSKEMMVKEERDRRIIQALRHRISVISSDLNINPAIEIAFRKLARRFNAQFEIKEFSTTVEECISRDSLRPEGKKVGVEVIRKWDEFQRKVKEEK